MNLEQKIEAILFYKAEPVSLKELVEILDVKKEDVLVALEALKTNLGGRGVVLVQSDNGSTPEGREYLLATSPEHKELIEKILKEERDRDLGRAGIETLSIIAYKGPISKKEIEYIRGVNSDYALRSLLLRGLVEKKASRTDERVIMYNITSETLLHLGLKNITDLPEYSEMKKQLEVVENLKEEAEEKEQEQKDE